MNRKNINFNSKKIKKTELYKNKKIFNIDDIDANKILVSKKEPYSKNNLLIYFIAYNDNVIGPLCSKLSKMTGYINEFNENKNTIIMSLRVNDEQLFKKYNKIWKKVEKLMRIDFESKPTYGYDDKYIKTKIKTYADITNFHNKKIPKEKVPCKCLSVIMLDSVIESDEKYYLQIFLEDCKYIQEKIKFENYIHEELDSDSDNDE